MRFYCIKRAETLLFVLAIICFVDLSSQDSGVSPYSRFGLGDPNAQVFAPAFGMGGLAIGVVDFVNVNPKNPSTLPYLGTPAFDIGMTVSRETASTTTQEVTDSYGRLEHFSLGLPMSKGKWGGGFSIRPYTVVGYNGSEDNFVPVLDITQTSLYSGSGGINKLDLSVARKFKVINDTSRFNNSAYLSVAATMNYYFGSINLTRSSIFPLGSGYHNTRLENSTTVNNVAPAASMNYRTMINKRLDKDDHSYSVLTIGATFEPGGGMKARRSQEVFSYIGNASGGELSKDSVSTFADRRGEVTLPSTIGLGASMEFYFRKKDDSNRRKLMLGLDYTATNWSSINANFGSSENFIGTTDSYSLMVGLQYTPNMPNVLGRRGKFFEMTTYRLGGRFGDTHITIDGQTLTENGISFGASFPILVSGEKKTDSQFTLGLEYGQRGSTEDGLIKEEFGRIMIGLSFHPDLRIDRWFHKRKYD